MEFSHQLTRCRSFMYRLPFVLLLATGCDNKSEPTVTHARSEAVVAAPGSTPILKTASPQPFGIEASKEEAAAKPRGALCSSKPNTAIPKSQLSGMGAANTPFAGGVPAQAGLTWVNLWAAWCEPCKKEVPILFSFQQELAKGGLNIQLHFISIDDDPRQLQRFLESQPADGIKQTFWLKEGQEREQWLPEVGLSPDPRLPVHLLVNRDGQIFCRIEGSIEAGDLEAVKATFAAL